MKNFIVSEVALQKHRIGKHFPEQIKAEGVHDHQPCLTRNANSTSLGRSKILLINIIKT